MIEFVLGINVHGIQNNAQYPIIPKTEMQMAVQTSFKTLLLSVLMLPFFSSSSDMFWTVVIEISSEFIITNGDETMYKYNQLIDGLLKSDNFSNSNQHKNNLRILCDIF